MRCVSIHRGTTMFVLVWVLSGPANTAGAGSLASEDQADAPRGLLTLKTERVVVFKDGYALIVKTATGTADGHGNVYTNSVPDGAVLGTYWAFSTQNPNLSIRAEWVESKALHSRTTTCITMHDLLRANEGHRITLDLVTQNEPSIEGTLIKVLDMPVKASDDPGEDVGGTERTGPALGRIVTSYPVAAQSVRPRSSVRDLSPSGGKFAVMRTGDGRTIVLPIAHIRRISGSDLETQLERRTEITSLKKRLTFDLGPAAADQDIELQLLYFTEGIRWIPTYRLDGSLVTEANLALQGEIMNEAEDVTNAAFDLVVGVPHFRFRSLTSPLTLERTLRSALAAAAPDLMGRAGNRNLSNALFSQRAGEWRGRNAAPTTPSAEAIASASDLADAGEHDLFVYHVGQVSLAKGARMTIPLWQGEVGLRHLYTFDIAVVRDARTGYRTDRPQTPDSSPLRLMENAVWHQLELQNTTANPWTTGAVLILRGFLPLGQELLTYTSVGGSTLLPVTVAVDIRGTHTEEELAREPNALSWDGHSYAAVRKKAAIVLTNHKKESATIRVSVGVGGRVVKASDDGVIRINDYRSADWSTGAYALPNNHSDVTWEFLLDAGESKTLAYEFMFYIR